MSLSNNGKWYEYKGNLYYKEGIEKGIKEDNETVHALRLSLIKTKGQVPCLTDTYVLQNDNYTSLNPFGIHVGFTSLEFAKDIKKSHTKIWTREEVVSSLICESYREYFKVNKKGENLNKIRLRERIDISQ